VSIARTLRTSCSVCEVRGPWTGATAINDKELAELIARPLDDDELKLEPIPRAPSLREKPALAALRDAAAERAKALDLPDGLLAARRHIESLLVTRRWPSALEGWRRDVLHDVLMPLLP